MSVSPADMLAQDMPSCLIVGNMVTGMCTTMGAGNNKMCSMPKASEVIVTAIPNDHLSISGVIGSIAFISMRNFYEEKEFV
ncbi:hypothetical protein KIN20_030651 [Parelaphostrongylus tenuis]|uniref:Uncharacterized protein n=1 Tax=Parelaphostrongylus tenuis TaxID=148309 RepID=A0AAD5R418_PARTN|nr:hypothetical protein KIN20_030651 [Parelaphostrongylus tenuis]